MKKLYFLVLIFLWTTNVFAACPVAEAQIKARYPFKAKISYETCANDLNDALSQFILGQMYLTGTPVVHQNILSALQYFYKSAQNGYAPAQRELAKLMNTMVDLGPKGQDALVDEMIRFYASINTPLPNQPMSDLAWLYLAADRAENKWFYNAPATSDREASDLVKKWENQKKPHEIEAAKKQAVAWRQQQLMRQAETLLSDKAFMEFQSIIYPSKESKPLMTKTQAIQKLKLIKERQK